MTYEDADVLKIRRFVTKCLESVDALVEFPGYNYAEVLIPDEFADSCCFPIQPTRKARRAGLPTPSSLSYGRW